jgi:protein SCO1/2
MIARLKFGAASRQRRLAVVASLCLCIMALLPQCVAEEVSIAQVIDQVGISPPPGAKVPLDLALVDADGRTVRLASLFSNRPVILHLVYYECPMLCKLSSDGLLRAIATLSLTPGRDFNIVTVSFDPREGPDHSRRARQVAIERCGREAVDEGWHFLTGDAQSIDRLCNAVGFRYAYNDKTRQFAHASGAFVLTPDGTLSRYLSGIEYSPRDLRFAIVEASAGKVGTAADHVLLMCYMYDPATGKYGLAIMTAMRTAGIATVGILGAAIFAMLRRERKSPARASNSERAGPSTAPAGVEDDPAHN